MISVMDLTLLTLAEGRFLQWILGFRPLESRVYHYLTLAPYNRRLRVLLVAMGTSLLVFIIYALFHNYILLSSPVGAKFQQPIADANANSILDSTPSSATSTVVLTAQPTQTIDPSITQSIKTIRTRRISSIIGALTSPNSISSWWVPRN